MNGVYYIVNELNYTLNMDLLVNDE